LAGHPGVKRMKKINGRERYNGQEWREILKNIVKGCQECQRNKPVTGR